MADNISKVKRFAQTVANAGSKLAEPNGQEEKELFETQKSYAEGRKALGIPEDDEPIRESYGASAPAKPMKPAPGDVVNSSAKYGSRSGEKRINTDEYTKPLGSSALGKIPLYDEGGEVKPTSPLGKVNVGDGDHEVAVLEKGEKVLTPAEAKDYDAEHPESVHGPLMSVSKENAMKGMPKIGTIDTDKLAMPELHASARDYIDRPSTLSGLEREYNRAGTDLFSRNQFGKPSERLVPMDSQGNLGDETEGDSKHDSNGGQNVTARIPRNSLGFIHTHNAGMSPGPSDFDAAAAKKAGMPNYEVSANEIDVVMPSGARGKVADIEREKGGRLNYKWSKIPLYDEGGDVGADNSNADPRLNGPQETTSTVADDLIRQDKEEAAKKGDLVGLGSAMLADKHVVNPRPQYEDRDASGSNTGDPGTENLSGLGAEPLGGRRTSPLGRIATPSLTSSGQPQTSSEMHQEVAGGPLVSGAPTDYTKSQRRDFAGMEFKARRADYDQRIQQAQELGTPEGQEEADRLRLAKMSYQNQNPWGSEGNHPGVGGKISHVLGRIGNIAGDFIAPGLMAAIPGTQLNKQVRAAGLGKAITEDTDNELRNAEANAATAKQIKSPWEPVQGEQFTHYDAQGRPDRQLYRNTGTGAQEWRGIPSSSGSSNGSASDAATASSGYYGNKQQPKESEKPTGDAGVKQFQEQLVSASNRLPKGYSLVEPKILPTDTNATAADKVKDYETAVNNAVLADRNDKALAARETAEESKERRAEERKERNIPVYAEDENGQTVLTNQFDAQLNKQPFEKLSPGDINKDRQAIRQLNDVQLNVSRYTSAAQKYDAAHLTPEQQESDTNNIAYVLNHSGFYDINASIAEGGHVELGPITAATEKMSRLKRSEQYKALSPEAKELLDGYTRTMASVPAYQKALTGIGRSNKEMLDLELANVANPTLGTTDILRKQAQFQENINRATEGFPKLPGLKRPSQIQDETEGKKATSTTSGSSVPKGATGIAPGSDGRNHYHDAQGHDLGVAQ